jgi:outer membrane protein, heavy metal efflux system
MKTTHIWIRAAALPLLWLPACRAQTGLDAMAALIGTAQHASAPASALTLDEVERTALEQNPEVHLAARKVAAAEAHVPVASALDDPQAIYRGWSVPLNQPWNYNQAQNMFMLGQSFLGRGKRGLRTSIARSEVDQAQDELEATRLRVRIEVRRAFIDMLHAQAETQIHDQHIGIAQQAIQAARIKYSVGKIPQMEILKAQVALARLAEHMIRFEKDAEVGRARLNTLMGRPADAPLEVRGDYAVNESLPPLDTLTATAMRSRPDLAEAAAAEEKSRKEQDLAKKAMVPDFSVAAGYMLMPSGQSPRNDYMIEGSMSLPWLNRHKHDGEVNEAQAALNANSAALLAMKNSAIGQIEESLAEARAAQHLAQIYQNSVRPQAEATLHAAVVAYENDQASFLDLLDSQMTVVDVDLASIDAVADFNNKMADLELAVGAPIVAEEVSK